MLAKRTVEGTTWQLQDAKARLSEVVQNALEGRPQVISRRGRDEVVVLRRSDRRSHHRRCGLLSHELPRPSPHNHVIARRERRQPEPNTKKSGRRACSKGVAVAALND